MKRPPNPISWTAKELIWLHAAISLPAFEFLEACEDIAGMSGRTVGAIAAKARSMRPGYRDRGGPYPRPAKPPSAAVPEPWEMEPLTKASLMGGRNAVVKPRGKENV